MSAVSQPSCESNQTGAPQELMRRNRLFAQRDHQILTAAPRLKVCIVSCPDPRVDPAQILGLQLGDAAVIRGAAGRISPIVMQQLLFLAQTAAAIGESEGPMELVLMQHTDCAIKHLLGEDKREMLAAFLGCSCEELEGRSPMTPTRESWPTSRRSKRTRSCPLRSSSRGSSMTSTAAGSR